MKLQNKHASPHIARCLKYAAVAILFVPLIAFAQATTDRKSFMLLSGSLAYELGKAYQMGKNCEKELSGVAPARAAGLFINYMEEQEVQQTMRNYENGSKSMSKDGCKSGELKSYISALQTRMANYINIATPFMRPY